MYSVRSRRTRLRYSARPFFVSTLVITVITTAALLVGRSDAPGHDNHVSHALFAAAPRAVEGSECHDVHQAEDQCAFVRSYCRDDEAGLLPYLTFYYCAPGSARPVAFAVLAGWLGLLFTTIGIAASDFFTVNLSTIAGVLGLSESLAGVTFLAFGNGSPDVFSTFAAMGSNSGSMAVGELIGAASFITAVVAGSMALVREFRVSRRTFVRDIGFFVAAISFAMVFLADGELQLWECGVMIGFYLFYVVAVVGWHWVSTRRRQRRLRDAASRGHFYSATGHGPEEELEPFTDGTDEGDDDADAAPMGGRRGSFERGGDIGALERGPRIEIDDGGTGALPLAPQDEDEADEQGRHLTAEMTSSMRVNRPRWYRSNTTVTPIRPSLVGALEFRSVLSSLSKERNMHLRVLPERVFSDSHGHHYPEQRRSAGFYSDMPDLIDLSPEPSSSVHMGRDRALSTGDSPLNLDTVGLQRSEPAASSSRPLSVPSIATASADGELRPLPSGRAWVSDVQSPDPHYLTPLRSSDVHSNASGDSSPLLLPFPDMCESPRSTSPQRDGQQPPPLTRTSGSERRHSIPIFAIPDEHRKPVRWWPYQLLPAPHVVFGTLFPTLQGWREKSVWDKMVSLVSAPSVFLLVATLPVVEMEGHHEYGDAEDGLEGSTVDVMRPAELGDTAPPVFALDGTTVLPADTEWQQYRRRTRSSSTMMSRSTAAPSPTLAAADADLLLPEPYAPGEEAHMPSPITIRITATPTATAAAAAAAVAAVAAPPPATAGTSISLPRAASKSVSSLEANHAVEAKPEAAAAAAGWNRWLVALQLFTGPLFIVLITWATVAEDLDQPVRALVRWTLCSLVLSLCLLALLLATTTAARRPRYHLMLCFLGFVISVAWISTVAGEVVGVLKALGVVLSISEAILGLTVFAVGNSLGDLVADVTVARLGYPVMALAACFGGPMLNILLGVGIGGAWMIVSSGNTRHAKNPDVPLEYRPYHIAVGGTLVISAATVLLTLVALLVVVPANRWVMSRRIGWGLIVVWTVSTAVNLVIELTGAWSDVALAGGGRPK